jgi:hypothetical protein
MTFVLSDIPKPSGNNSPGMSEEILIATKSSILAFPGVIAYANPGDTLVLDGDITFEAADGFVSLYATKDTVQLLIKKVGMKDSKGWNIELPFFVPSLNAAFAELLSADPDVLLLVKKPDCVGTEYMAFGTDCRALEVTGDFDSSLANDDSGRHGWSAMISGYLPTFHYYNGTITMKP